MTPRSLFGGALAALALVAAGAMPAFAEKGGDRDFINAVQAMPHSEAVSQGTPVQIGTGQHGTPRFAYQGPGSGNLSNGVAHVVGQNGRTPVIEYTQPGQ